MGYISKINLTFINFVNRKYRKHKVFFRCFDDYILWLYYDYLGSNKDLYYAQLEADMMAYSNNQTGSAREIEREEDLKDDILEVLNLYGEK